MPVILESRKHSSHPHELLCDVCTKHTGWADEDWAQYSGYGRGEPKFAIYCDQHWKEKYMPYILGMHHQEIEIERVKTMATEETTKTTVSSELVKNNELQWDNIDGMIGRGECKVATLAKELNVPINDLRKSLIAHYGDQIEFRRGRTGGVYWKKA